MMRPATVGSRAMIGRFPAMMKARGNLAQRLTLTLLVSGL